MLDARFSHLYFYQSLNRLQRGLSATAELLVDSGWGQVRERIFFGSCSLLNVVNELGGRKIERLTGV